LLCLGFIFLVIKRNKEMLGVVGVAQWLSVCLACTRLDLIPSKKKKERKKKKRNA
jgi:hypothetical protein